MGWKACALIATCADEGYLTSFPPHEPDRARALLSLLDGKYAEAGNATFERGVYSGSDEELYIGAYEHAIVLGSSLLVEEAFTGAVPKLVGQLGEILPGCRVLMIVLHSVVDLFGYACFENGVLLRARAGSAEDGVFLDMGEPLPAERKVKEFDETIDGEEMVMELCRPFLGCRLDQYSAWDLQMELFIRKKSWLKSVSGIFGRNAPRGRG